jgi:hypothetical protein
LLNRTLFRFSFFFFAFLCQVAQNSDGIFAESTTEDLTPLAGDILKQNFRVREQVKVILDGSDASSSIIRSSQVVNELVYFSPQKWRVRRQLPFTEQNFEFTMTEKGVKVMNPFNHGVEPPYPVQAKTYLEVIISPIRFARAWSMDGAANVDQLIRLARKGPIQNPDGDRIEFEEKNGVITLKLIGKILHDGKTKVGIESIWQVSDEGHVTETQLNHSLMGSF